MNVYRGILWVKEGILPYPKHGSCVHYEPAILQKRKRDEMAGAIAADAGEKRIREPARSYIVKDGAGRDVFWHCEACGMMIKDKHRKKIQQIVEYLNQGGDDDRKLASMFSGVEIGEIVQYSSKEILLKCGAECSKEYVPPKNVY